MHRSALVSSHELMWMDTSGKIRVQYSGRHRSPSESHKHFGDVVGFIALLPSLKMEFFYQTFTEFLLCIRHRERKMNSTPLHSSTDPVSS